MCFILFVCFVFPYKEYLNEQLSCENSPEENITSNQSLLLTLKGREEQAVFNPFQVHSQSCAKVFNQVCENLKPWL